MDKELIEKLDSLGSEEDLDRSTIARKLLKQRYKDYLIKKAADRYKKGKITVSKAVEEAEITVWNMEQFLIEQGYKSGYCLKDLRRESSHL